MSTQEISPITKAARIALVIVLLPLIVPLAIIGLVLFLLHRLILYLLIWLLWVPRGKDVLFVTSESPIWKQYMNEQVLPLVESRAVSLNWSERKSWDQWSFAAHVFRTFGGRRQFNPMVVVFRPLKRAEIFRFFLPFRDWQRGYCEPVERLRRDLAGSLSKGTEQTVSS
jgi:hypothetical protein